MLYPIVLKKVSKKPEINDELSDKWQNIINGMADITGANAVLINKINQNTIEVICKNNDKNNDKDDDEVLDVTGDDNDGEEES